MTTNFTFRDFIVYLLSGLALILSLGLVFRECLFSTTVLFFGKYEFIRDFSFLVTIFLIPVIYLIGHLMNTLDYMLLKWFVWLHKRSKSRKIGVLQFFVKVNEVLFYRHRAAYQIVRHWKRGDANRSFSSTDGFWSLCAKLQVANQYASAEYWSVLNDFFKAVYLTFVIGALVAACNHEWVLALVFTGAGLLSFFRAVQYAEFFVKTVCRLSSVSSPVTPKPGSYRPRQ